MIRNMRLSEKWFHRALWLVAALFAWFLIGLGNAVVGDLPQVESDLRLEQFYDTTEAPKLKARIEQLEKTQEQLREQRLPLSQNLEQIELEHERSQAAFAAWSTTRLTTQESSQNPELIKRTHALEALQQQVQAARKALLDKDQLIAQQDQTLDQARKAWEAMETQADGRYTEAIRKQELRVFGYRLALTLPLLLIGVWLFKRFRKHRYWPFVWGFIGFALFAFFVELVPYLPSYGGYIRYAVGIILTLILGRSVILKLQDYLEKQRLAETQNEGIRRQSLQREVAIARWEKSVCPGCERKLNLNTSGLDFCPHCGIRLHSNCPSCHTRNSCFNKYCFSCGLDAEATPTTDLTTAASESAPALNDATHATARTKATT